ncbi:radical SAM protein [Kribbella sp. NPDC003557]|uniref:radical SAM protein n=1 Tax=Kribbella sp. NPDC003557 TaxID=3154449 RepID=UPI0033B7A072
MYDPHTTGRSTLRFLLTDKCNLRCMFCHNEFQGDAGARRSQDWDFALVHELLLQAARRGRLRAKFSGGEPTLHWQALLQLVESSHSAGATDLTLFSNLTLLGPAKLATLHEAGVTKLHANLPSFDRSGFAARTDQTRWDVETVLANAEAARGLGFEVQFNLVVTGPDSSTVVSDTVAAELSLADRHRDSWDALAIVADDWAPDPAAIQQQIANTLLGLPDAAETREGPKRSYLFTWRGRRLLASRCTQWHRPAELAAADLYIVPPGVALRDYARGRAYRLRRRSGAAESRSPLR